MLYTGHTTSCLEDVQSADFMRIRFSCSERRILFECFVDVKSPSMMCQLTSGWNRGKALPRIGGAKCGPLNPGEKPKVCLFGGISIASWPRFMLAQTGF